MLFVYIYIMSVVNKYIDKSNKLKTNLERVLVTELMKNADMIISFLQEKQLGMGKNSLGKPLKFTAGEGGNGYYGKSTKGYAKAAGIRFEKEEGHAYNFQWTGSTFNSMDLKVVESSDYEIFTKDGKQDMLESIYGRIFDLTEEHNYILNMEVLYPALIEYYLDNLPKI